MSLKRSIRIPLIRILDGSSVASGWKFRGRPQPQPRISVTQLWQYSKSFLSPGTCSLWIKLHRIGKSGSTDPLTECRISTSRQGLVDKTAPTIRMLNGFLFCRNGILRLRVPSMVRDSLLAQLSFF